MSRAKVKNVVPEGLTTIFDRILQAHKCTHWYVEQSHSSSNSDAKHGSFVGVSEDKFEALQPCMLLGGSSGQRRRKRASESATKDPSTKQKVLSDMFEQLKLEDLDDVEKEAAANKPKLSGLPQAAIGQDDESVEDEFMFAIHSFMQDPGEIRSFIPDIWAT